jgi:hypothetical protein
VKSVDYSAFSTGWTAVPVATFQKIREVSGSDMLLNIPGGWHGAVDYPQARLSIINAREAGFTHHATYTALNTLPGKISVEKAQAVVGNEWEHLSFIGIDVELETTPDIVLDACHAAVAMGVRPVVYTAKWAWDQFMAGNLSFSDFWLWNAFYDNDPDIDFARFPFGGWALDKVAGEQYTNTTTINGMGFDFNWFSDSFVTLAPASTVPPLVQLVEAWKKDMADLAVNAADLIHTPFDVLRLALHTIYTDRRNIAWASLLGAK